jgi:hypothetical protein
MNQEIWRWANNKLKSTVKASAEIHSQSIRRSNE